MGSEDENDSQQQLNETEQEEQSEPWEPSSFTMEGDGHEWTITDSSQLNDDRYFDTSDQDQIYDSDFQTDFSFSDRYDYSDGMRQEEEEYYNFQETEEFSDQTQLEEYENENELDEISKRSEEDYSYNEMEHDLDQEDFFHDFDNQQNLDSYEDQDFDVQQYEQFEQLEQDEYIESDTYEQEDDYHIFRDQQDVESGNYQSDISHEQQTSTESHEDRLQSQIQTMHQDLLDLQIQEEWEDISELEQEHWEHKNHLENQMRDLNHQLKKVRNKKKNRKSGYKHFNNQKNYSIHDHIPNLKRYKHDLNQNTPIRLNNLSKKNKQRYVKKPKGSLNPLKKTFEISTSIAQNIGNAVKVPISFGKSINNIIKNKLENKKLTKQRDELLVHKYPAQNLSRKIYENLKGNIEFAGKLYEKLVFQVLGEYHTGISIKQIGAHTGLEQMAVKLILDGLYTELAKGSGIGKQGQSQNPSGSKSGGAPQTINQLTDTENEDIIDLWLQNKSAKEIARILGLPLSVVEGFVTILNLPQTVKPQSVQPTVSKPWTKKDEDYLVQNYGKMTPHQIGMNLGRTRKAVIGKKNKLKQKKRDFDAKQNSKKLNRDLNSKVVYTNKMQKEIVRMHIQELRGLKNIGSKIKKDARTWQYLIHEIGIDILSPGSLWKKVKEHFEGKYDVQLTEQMNEIIIGTLLGDGNIRIQTKGTPHPNQLSMTEYKQILNKVSAIQETLKIAGNLTYQDIKFWNYAINKFKDLNTATFRIHKGIFEREWVKMLFDEFTKFLPATPYIKKINGVEDPESFKWSCGFDTQATFQLQKFWEDWYVLEGDEYKKIIPHSLTQLTPNILLHWYIGDGSYSGGSIHLYTFGFSYDDHLRIQQMLLDIGINSTIKERVDDDGVKTHFIFISSKKSNREILFDYLSQAKFFAKANELFPHKFTKEIEYTDTLNETRLKHPEYFTYDEKLNWKYYYNS